MIIDMQNMIHPKGQTPEELLKRMDRAGVDRAVVYSYRNGFMDNDYTAAAVRQFSDRLLGLAYIYPKHESVAYEIRRVRDLGLKGIVLNPKYDEYSLSVNSQWFMEQIFSACCQQELIILVEGWGDSSNTLPYQFRDLAWLYKDLKIVLGHMSMMGGYDDVHRVVRQCPNLYTTTSTTTTSQVSICVDEAGAEKVLLGTYTPVEELEVGMIKVNLGVSDPEKRKMVLGENARKLFGI